MALYSLASGARHGLSYIAEATPGVTPTTPTTVNLRHSSCSLDLSRDTLQSNELRSDRQIPAVRTGTNTVAGDIAFELSYGEFDAFLEAALCGTWVSSVVKAGTAKKYFTLQRAFTDIGVYAIYRGCAVNKFSLSVKPNAMVTGSFGIVGMSAEYSTAALTASPTASQTSEPFDSYTGYLRDGVNAVAIVTGMDLSLDNGIDPKYGLFSRDALAVPWGRSTLTGTLSAFFQDSTLLNKFINETAVSLEMKLQQGNDSYTINIPKLFYTGAKADVSNEGLIELSLPWSAVLDGTLGTNIQITRATAQ